MSKAIKIVTLVALLPWGIILVACFYGAIHCNGSMPQWGILNIAEPIALTESAIMAIVGFCVLIYAIITS